MRFYPHWCQHVSADPLARDSLRAWVAELVEAGMAPSTIRARQLPVRRFAAWLAEEGEISRRPDPASANPSWTSRWSRCGCPSGRPSSPLVTVQWRLEVYLGDTLDSGNEHFPAGVLAVAVGVGPVG